MEFTVSILFNNYVISTQPQFIWESTNHRDSSYLIYYNIYWDLDSGFTSPNSVVSLTDTTYSMPDTFNRSTKHYWHVLAYDDFGDSLFSNETWSFYIDGYPIPPEPIAPLNGINADSSTVFTWYISTDPDTFDAVSYTIQIDDDSLFTTPEVNQTGLTSGMALDDAYAIMLGDLEGVDNLLEDTQYYWRVRSDDNYGLSSDWPDSLHYFTYLHQNHAPNAPDSGFSPANDNEVISLTPLITWHNATDPDPEDNAENLSYAIKLSQDSAFGGFIYNDTTAAGINQIQPASELFDNSQYYYAILTIDDEGLESDWSLTQNFWTNHYNYPPEPFPLVTPLADIKRVDYYTYFNWGSTVD
jgi:hypothetical protein